MTTSPDIDGTIKLTTQEISEKLGISKTEAYGLVSTLESQNLLIPTGVKKTQGKGNGAKIYRVDPQLPTKMQTLLSKLLQ